MVGLISSLLSYSLFLRYFEGGVGSLSYPILLMFSHWDHLKVLLANNLTDYNGPQPADQTLFAKAHPFSHGRGLRFSLRYHLTGNLPDVLLPELPLDAESKGGRENNSGLT